MSQSDSAQITGLLSSWRNGDKSSLDALVPLVYQRLHQIARRELGGKQGVRTLRPTGLINEAYLKLVSGNANFHDRAHFFAAAAQIMRRVLVDYYRADQAAKRGGAARALTFDEPLHAAKQSIDLSVLEDALSALQALDERKCRLAELHYFGGLSYDDIALVENVSRATVARELQFAKAWLMTEIDS